MKINENLTGMDPTIKAIMQSAFDRLAKGRAFTKQERERAAAEIARIREANAKLFGVQNVVVEAICESRRS